MTHTPDEIIAKLGELSPDEIAHLLRDAGVRGHLRLGEVCPVARYVKLNSATLTVNIGRSRYAAFDEESRCTATGELPRSVKHFALRFDGGRYPDLIA